MTPKIVRLVVVALTTAAALLPASPAGAAPPSNDAFAGATVAAPLPFTDTVDITDATYETGESLNCFTDGSVWYQVTAPSDGQLRADPSGSGFADVCVTGWRDTGSGLGGLQLICCAAIGTLTTPVTSGEVIYLQVGRVSDGGGLLQIDIGMVAPPPNDDFDDAQVIASTPYENTVDVTAAGREPDEPSDCSFFGGPTVWYSFTPTETQFAMAASTSGPVAVYQADGPGFAGLTSISCAFSGGVELQAVGGTTYLFQVGGEFSLTEPPPPPGDDIASAIPIGDSPRFFAGDSTSHATAAPDDPDCLGSDHTMWFTFTSPTAMRLEAAVQPAFFGRDDNLTLSAWTGTPGDLSQLACSGDELVPLGKVMAHVELNAPAGQPIYFMVGNNEGSPGDSFFFSMQSPLIITPSVDQLGLVTRDGLAVVTGTATCNRGETGASLPGSIAQSIGPRSAQANLFGGTSADCATAPAEWSVGTYSSNGTPFAPGRAMVTVGPVDACDSSGCQPGWLIGRNDGPTVTREITLRRTR